jgi:hypothetical protein
MPRHTFRAGVPFNIAPTPSPFLPPVQRSHPSEYLNSPHADIGSQPFNPSSYMRPPTAWGQSTSESTTLTVTASNSHSLFESEPPVRESTITSPISRILPETALSTRSAGPVQETLTGAAPLCDGRKNTMSGKTKTRIYVHCPFRIHFELHPQALPLERSDCVMHFSEARYLREHIYSCVREALPPCSNCGFKITVFSGMKIPFRGQSDHCRCMAPLTSCMLQIRKACQIFPARLCGGVLSAFRLFWQNSFPHEPVPEERQWTCPGRRRCHGFTRHMPPATARHKQIRAPAPPYDLQASMSTRKDSSVRVSQRQTLLTRSRNVSPSRQSLLTSGAAEESGFNYYEVFDQLCENLDELRAQIGDRKLRDILSELLGRSLEEPRVKGVHSQSTGEPPSESSNHETIGSSLDSAQKLEGSVPQMSNSRTPCQVSDLGFTYIYDAPGKPHFRYVCRCCGAVVAGSEIAYDHMCSCPGVQSYKSSRRLRRTSIEKPRYGLLSVTFGAP